MSAEEITGWLVRAAVAAIVAAIVLLFRRMREAEARLAETKVRLAAVEKQDNSATFGALRNRIEELDRISAETRADVAAVKASVAAIERTLHLIHEHLMDKGVP